ncbi:MAG: hypothetical protein ACT4N8_03915 [Sphingosinicella sp.]|uniref:hypothetical protein n=1 Tax=Sphingosinicella sp. TaxID=1917971 RepID=UPI004037C254
MADETGPNDDFDESWIDEPFADPAIREDYTKALGRLILAHNEVDFWISALLTKAVAKIEPDGALDSLTDGTFHQRATNLLLLMKLAPQLPLGGVGKGRLLELNGFRNILAHGHVDQDPYEGTFDVVRARRRGQNVKRAQDIDAAKINARAKELEDIASHMSTVNDFFDVPIDQKEFEAYMAGQLEAGGERSG